MFRAMIEREKYYQAKFKFIPMKSRTKLVLLIRAQIKRNQYMEQRAKYFEGYNRQLVASYIYATIQRQDYYEKKLKFADTTVREIEGAKLADQEHYSDMLNCERAAEFASQEYMQELMKQEDDYAESLIVAAMQGQFDKMKLAQVNICEEKLSEARVSQSKVEKSADQIDDLDNIFENTVGKMLMNHMKQILADIETKWQQEFHPNNPAVKRIEWQESEGHRDEVDLLHPALIKCPLEHHYSGKPQAYVRAWREHLYGELAAIEMEALDGYEQEANREMEQMAQQTTPQRHPDHDDHSNSTRAPDEQHSSLDSATKEFLAVNLDCNVAPEEMKPEVAAALKRAVSKLIGINTLNVRLSI